MAVAVGQIVVAMDRAYKHPAVTEMDLNAIIAAAYAMRLRSDKLSLRLTDQQEAR